MLLVKIENAQSQLNVRLFSSVFTSVLSPLVLLLLKLTGTK